VSIAEDYDFDRLRTFDDLISLVQRLEGAGGGAAKPPSALRAQGEP